MKSHFLLTLSHLYCIVLTLKEHPASSFSLPLPRQRILCSTSVLAMCEQGLGSCCRLDWGGDVDGRKESRACWVGDMRKNEDKKMSERRQKEKKRQ